jgi:hypothetical protein
MWIGLALVLLAGGIVVGAWMYFREQPAPASRQVTQNADPAKTPDAKEPPAPPQEEPKEKQPAEVPKEKDSPPVHPAPVDTLPAYSEPKLPGEVADMALGGGGRLLILHLPSVKQLAIFDVVSRKIVHSIPLPEPAVKFAAGSSHLIVLLPDARLVQVWNLRTFEREKSIAFPPELTGEEIGTVSMGYSSDGPLFLTLPRPKRTLVMDPATLALTDLKWSHFGDAFGPLHLRAAADGSALAGWGGGWAGLEIALLSHGRVTGARGQYQAPVEYALPSYDGRVFYTNLGLYSREFILTPVEELKDAYLVPAREPGFFLAHRTAVGRVAFYTADRKRLFELTDEGAAIPGNQPAARLARPDVAPPLGNQLLTPDKRYHYYPMAGLLVILPAVGRDRLLLVRVDLGEMLEKSGEDYLFVTSVPPAEVTKGEPFRYPIVVKSKKGGVRYQVEAGPKGLTVAHDGMVRWDVPADFTKSVVDITVGIADASGEESFHSFSLALAGGKGSPVVTPEAPDSQRGGDSATVGQLAGVLVDSAVRLPQVLLRELTGATALARAPLGLSQTRAAPKPW